MKGIITRGNKLSIRFQDAKNAWRTVGTGLDDTPANRAHAAELLADAMAEAAHHRENTTTDHLYAIAGRCGALRARDSRLLRALASPW